MTFEWPSWVHPLPFPFPELHNNFWIEIIALLLEFCMNAKLDLWQQIYLFLKTGEKYMNNFEKIFLLIFKNISRFRNDQLTFNCSQKQKTKNRWRQKILQVVIKIYQEHSIKMETDNGGRILAGIIGFWNWLLFSRILLFCFAEVWWSYKIWMMSD